MRKAVMRVMGLLQVVMRVMGLLQVIFTTVTKERIEMIQGSMLAGLFFFSAWLVNNKTFTNGEAVGIIQAFISGSRDIVEMSSIALKMKFNSEGLRMLSLRPPPPPTPHPSPSACLTLPRRAGRGCRRELQAPFPWLLP